jgi:hypothetical protein
MVLCEAEILCFFILTNFAEGNRARTIAIRLLDSAASRGTLTNRLGRKHFLGSFATSGFADLFFLSPSAVYIGLTDDISTSAFLLLMTHRTLNDLVSTNLSDNLTIDH